MKKLLRITLIVLLALLMLTQAGLSEQTSAYSTFIPTMELPQASILGATVVNYYDYDGETEAEAEIAADSVSLLTSVTEPMTITEGWYMTGEENAVLDEVVVEGDVKLIIADGTNIFFRAMDLENGTLTVYGQTENTGVAVIDGKYCDEPMVSGELLEDITIIENGKAVRRVIGGKELLDTVVTGVKNPAGYFVTAVYADEEKTTLWDPSVQPITEETVLFATSCKRTFTFVYDTNGAETENTELTAMYMEDVPVAEDPVREGWTFAGWSLTQDEKAMNAPRYNLKDLKARESLTLYAVWKKNITVSAESATKAYDGTPLTAGHTVSGELFEGDTVNAVLSVSLTDAGTVANTIDECTVLNGSKDVTGNYMISLSEGTLTVEKREVTLTSASDSKMYDGTALTNDTVIVGGEGFAEGEGAAYTVTGTITDAGNAVNAFDYTLSAGTKAENYVITKTEGTLTVEKRDVILTSASDSKMYDGTVLTNDTVVIGGNGFAEGEGATCTATGTIKDAGNAVNAFDYTLSAGTKAENYNITKVEGTLTVTKRDVILTSASASKMYDGKAFKDETVTVSGSGFVEGEGYEKLIGIAELTDAGSARNEIRYVGKIYSGTNFYNYRIYVREGTLTVTPRTVILTSGSATKKYDGTPLTNDTVVVGGDCFVNGDGATYTVSGTITDAGTAENTFTYTLSAGTKAENYNIITVAGPLTVTKRNVTLTSGSATKKYDGIPLTNDQVEASGDGFASGEGAAYFTFGSAMNAGTENNSFDYMLNGNTKDDNYNFTKVEGKLTVLKRNIYVVSGPASKAFDNKPLTNPAIDIAGDGFIGSDGFEYCRAVGSITNVGSTQNTIDYELNSDTVQGNYNIVTTEGILTVTEK